MFVYFLFFKQKTAYEMRISDWSSDVCFFRSEAIAQDGEVHEVDRGVRLEQVAPGPLAGMRRARDEKDAQPVADAVDDDDRPVVDESGSASGRERGCQYV